MYDSKWNIWELETVGSDKYRYSETSGGIIGISPRFFDICLRNQSSNYEKGQINQQWKLSVIAYVVAIAILFPPVRFTSAYPRAAQSLKSYTEGQPNHWPQLKLLSGPINKETINIQISNKNYYFNQFLL